jgi:hypothetical protein
VALPFATNVAVIAFRFKIGLSTDRDLGVPATPQTGEAISQSDYAACSRDSRGRAATDRALPVGSSRAFCRSRMTQI